MIEVELPDGSVAEFDDGTPDDQIQKAVRRHIASQRVRDMSSFRKTLYGAERSLDEAAMGLKQVFPKALGGGLNPEESNELAIRREMEDQIPGSGISRFVGDVGLYAAPTLKVMNLANRLRGLGTGTKALLGAGAAGAGAGAVQPVLEGEDRVDNTALGAAFGVGGQAAGSAIGRGIEGIVAKNPNIANLPTAVRDKLTLGQTADRNTLSGRIASATEEKMQSIPLVGERIRNSRAQATDTWRDAVLTAAAPKNTNFAGGTTREQLDKISREYATRYANALRGHQVGPSRLFESQLLKITNNPRSGLTDQQQREVQDMVGRYYQSMFHGNSSAAPAGTGVVTQGGQRGTPISIDAENAKGFEAFLTKKAMEYGRSQAPGASDYARMFNELERAWSTSYRRALPSSARVATKELDRTYPSYKNVERAASYVGNEEGAFTPSQLVSAIRARSSAPQFARQRAPDQKAAQAARDTLPDQVPNSGTADRAVAMGTIGGLIVDPVTTAKMYGASIPAAAMMTTRAGRNAMTGDTRIQEMLKQMRLNEAIRTGAPVAGVAGGTQEY